jgi:hypothetical protein
MPLPEASAFSKPASSASFPTKSRSYFPTKFPRKMVCSPPVAPSESGSFYLSLSASFFFFL